jgi:hypothetical protein
VPGKLEESWSTAKEFVVVLVKPVSSCHGFRNPLFAPRGPASAQGHRKSPRLFRMVEQRASTHFIP